MKTFDILCSVCVTQHNDYVIYDSQCVAVRSRATGEWLEEHHAIDERIALVPTAGSNHRLAPWDLVIHTFGLQVQVGPVLSVTKADESIKGRMAELLRRRPRALRTTSGDFGLAEPG